MQIHLPVDDFVDAIRKELGRHNALVVTAAPGAGKTTRIPPALLSVSKKKILVLEPRRIAAISAAHRVAEENKYKVGEEVGYEVRFDRKVSDRTKLIFVTEALLTRKMLTHSSLDEFDLVVLDEFHERSLHTDLAIGLLKELQSLERADLKIVVMSATLDAKKISEFLNQAPIIDIPGKLCPLETVYDSRPQNLLWSPEVSRRTIEKIKQATEASEKDTLVFLPGVFEIQQVQNFLNQEKWTSQFEIVLLHGRLELEEQRRALKPLARRKIILSTNVAESSITVDGLDTVVDSGLERSAVFQMQSGFSKLTTHRISLASATQRAGRAARQFPGKCFKLWAPIDERSFTDYSLPEIKTQDLSETLLTLFYMGVQNPKSFSWYEEPPAAHVDFALKKLETLELVKAQKISDLGKKVLLQPLPLRLAILMENFRKEKKEGLGAWVCALLSERGSPQIGTDSSQDECDLIHELRKSRSQRERLRAVALQLSQEAATYIWNDSDEEILKKILVKSFADRLGRRRPGQTEKGLLSSGRGVALARTSTVRRSQYFIALDGTDTESSNETLISKASGLSEDFLRSYFSNDIKVETYVFWDDTKKSFFEKKSQALFGLHIGSEHVTPAKADWIEAHLPQVATENWNWILENNENLRDWWSRFEFYSQKVNQDFFNFFDRKKVQEIFEEACFGQKSLKALLELNLVYFFESKLPHKAVSELNSKIPAYLEAAKGRQVKVQYRGEKAPAVELKIQDAFVWKKTPKVGNGILVTVVLLAPNYRPAQVTQDLEGFWKGSYHEIRKELKARYPKHDWPEKV